jgi:RNA polymerase sigma factor (sigma-70 family)
MRRVIAVSSCAPLLATMSPRISIRLLAAQSDQRLVTLVSEGHERAFEALVQRYRRSLLRYCRRIGLSDARAEDVLQQAFLQAWMALGRGTEVRELQPWLYRIVHNAAVNAMRSPTEGPHSELTDALQAGAVPAGESELERRIAVRDALGEVAALPRMQRQAIFLTAVDGQSHDEVASALGITHGALRGLLYRARSTLRGAAAALTPQPLLAWACAGAGPGAPTAERLAELTAGGGAAGIAGLLLKGAVVTVTAGALATGATVVNLRHDGGSRRSARAASAGRASPASSAGSSGLGETAAVASAPRIGAAGGSRSVRRRGSAHGRLGARSGHRARHGHRGAGDGGRLGAGSREARGQAETQLGTGREGSSDVGSSSDGSAEQSVSARAREEATQAASGGGASDGRQATAASDQSNGKGAGQGGESDG